MRKSRPQDCHSEMFCADSYQRNVLYIIIQAYKCQQLFLTFSIFFRTLVFSGFFCFFYLFRRAFQRGCDLRLPKYFPVPAARRRDVIPANNMRICHPFINIELLRRHFLPRSTSSLQPCQRCPWKQPAAYRSEIQVFSLPELFALAC